MLHVDFRLSGLVQSAVLVHLPRSSSSSSPFGAKTISELMNDGGGLTPLSRAVHAIESDSAPLLPDASQAAKGMPSGPGADNDHNDGHFKKSSVSG